MTTTYHGATEGAPGERCRVWVTEDGTVRPLAHQIHHSPTGFAWGYQGSGPADLARSLLTDRLGRIPHPAIYQCFKANIVAAWPSDRAWSMTAEAIDAWLAHAAVPYASVWNNCPGCGGPIPCACERWKPKLR